MPADTIAPRRFVTRHATGPGWLDRWCRQRVRAALSAIDHGTLIVRERGARERFGAPPGRCAPLTITVRDPRFWRRVALGGSLGAGEAYIDHCWDCSDLTGLIRLFIRNADALGRTDALWSRSLALFERLRHALRDNTRRGSRRNIAAHYDLGNGFYRLLLDETMMYSCATFATPDQPLIDAQRDRLTRIGRKLDLTPRDHLLEIGTGWGGLAVHLAQTFGCRVTTTTISAEQYRFARERVAAAGLAGRVTVLPDDYRALRGQYDKLVSIEMIEAVGRRWYGTFFEQCQRLLRPDGQMLIQAITIAEPFFASAARSVDFIKRYVFPGSCIPSTGVLLETARRRSDFYLFDLEEIGPHYAETLRRWRASFEARLDDVRALGFSEAFVRLWRYYLAYCEAGFEERTIGNVQLLMTRPACRRPPLPRDRVHGDLQP